MANADESEEDDDAVAVLKGLQAEPSAHFFRRLRGSIERRILGAQLLEMGVESIAEVALQYLSIVFKAGAGSQEKGEPHD